ncbi:MAG: enoyl-CoA hydratase-related protein [Acidimicrobiales bacterium]
MTSAPDELVTLDIDDPVAVVTLRRPDKLNAFTHPMLRALEQAVADAADDRRVVGIVITAEGRGFSAGLDADALAAASAAASNGDEGANTPPPSGEHRPGLFSYLLETPKPIIAAVNGVAAGGGFVLAAKCDLRFAAASASFVTVFSKRGLIAEHGLSYLLPRQVGLGDALDLLWSSRRLDAAEAKELGFAQRVVGDDDLLDAACDYVRALAAEVSPASLADTKRLLYAHAGTSIDTAFEEADMATYQALERPDATEGVASLLERRAPDFDRLGTR